MNGSQDFAHIDVYKFALLSHAEKEVCSWVYFSRKFTKITFRVLQLIQLISGMDCHILSHHLDHFILFPCAFSLSAQIPLLVNTFLVCLAWFSQNGKIGSQWKPSHSLLNSRCMCTKSMYAMMSSRSNSSTSTVIRKSLLKHRQPMTQMQEVASKSSAALPSRG
jgi:hypothetical protein